MSWESREGTMSERPVPQSSDEDLALKVRHGDSSAFSELVQRHSDRFFRVAYRLLHDRGEAEEMTQNAFLKFWQNPGAFDVDKKAKWTTWFYRVVVNGCLDLLKKRRREVYPKKLEAVDPTPNAEEDLEQRRRHLALDRAMLDLPDRQRVALSLCFAEGLSNQAAADAMGVRLKALQSLLIRGKAKLRDALTLESKESRR